MKSIRFIALVMVCGLISAGSAFAQYAGVDTGVQQAAEAQKALTEDQQKAMAEAKKAVIGKNWQQAVEIYNKLVAEAKDNRYLDESMYWLGYSLYQQSKALSDLDYRLDGTKRAIEEVNVLIEKFPLSAWIDDASMLRIEMAQDLAKRGLAGYEKYLVEGLKTSEQDPNLEIKLVALNALLQTDQ